MSLGQHIMFPNLYDKYPSLPPTAICKYPNQNRNKVLHPFYYIMTDTSPKILINLKYQPQINIARINKLQEIQTAEECSLKGCRTCKFTLVFHKVIKICAKHHM